MGSDTDEDDAGGDDKGRNDTPPAEVLPERCDPDQRGKDDAGLPDCRDLGERSTSLGPQHDAVRGSAQQAATVPRRIEAPSRQAPSGRRTAAATSIGGPINTKRSAVYANGSCACRTPMPSVIE